MANGGPGPVVAPELGYRDGQAAIDWLTGVLGLSSGVVITKPGGGVAHAELWGRNGVVVLEEPDGAERRPVTTCLVAESAIEVDRLYAQALAAGAPMEFQLADTPFGSHQFAVRDPEENVWVIGTYQPEPPT